MASFRSDTRWNLAERRLFPALSGMAGGHARQCQWPETAVFRPGSGFEYEGLPGGIDTELMDGDNVEVMMVILAGG